MTLKWWNNPAPCTFAVATRVPEDNRLLGALIAYEAR